MCGSSDWVFISRMRFGKVLEVRGQESQHGLQRRQDSRPNQLWVNAARALDDESVESCEFGIDQKGQRVWA